MWFFQRHWGQFLGFCDPDWLKAVEGQMERYTHMSNLFYSQINAETADLLCQKTGYDQVFFANSGAEANEGAIKLARKYSFDKTTAKSRGISSR